MNPVGGSLHPPTRQPIKVLVVDDHKSFAQLVVIAVTHEPDIIPLGTAGSVAEALEMIELDLPDVVLMDYHLPDMDGVGGTAKIKEAHPEIRVLIVTGETNPTVMARAALAGAAGFLLKQGSIDEILHAIRVASEGGILVDRATLAAVLERVREPNKAVAAAAEMTPREQEVLVLMGEGLDPQGIARRLGISVNTCRGYVKNILSKLEVHSQLEAVVHAVRAGLIPSLSG